MKIFTNIFASLSFVLLLSACSNSAEATKAKNIAFVDSLISKMTLEEKLGQMTQVDRQFLNDISDISKYGFGSLLSGGGSTPKLMSQKLGLICMTAIKKKLLNPD